MRSVVCTLFEGSYHYGVAALANSLASAGYRGDLVAGYRGALPSWAQDAKPAGNRWSEDSRALSLPEGPRVVFVPLATAVHFSNFKPDFMLELLSGPAADADAIFYIDPDICVERRWCDFEQWVAYGVALCEDVNSPLAQHHPRRMAWREYFAKFGLSLNYAIPEYVNAGFIGMRRQDEDFLKLWSRMMEFVALELGSMSSTKVSGGAAFASKGPLNCFDCSDQDALNAALEASEATASVVGAEAMGFKSGLVWLPHAVGGDKPWDRNYLRMALGGVPPRRVDKSYWSHALGPIAAHSRSVRWQKVTSLRLGALIGRFVRRS